MRTVSDFPLAWWKWNDGLPGPRLSPELAPVTGVDRILPQVAHARRLDDGLLVGLAERLLVAPLRQLGVADDGARVLAQRLRLVLGHHDVVADHLERVAGVRARLLAAGARLDGTHHVGRQLCRGAADQLEQVLLQVPGVHGTLLGGDGTGGNRGRRPARG
jgi:hypothetical protein